MFTKNQNVFYNIFLLRFLAFHAIVLRRRGSTVCLLFRARGRYFSVVSVRFRIFFLFFFFFHLLRNGNGRHRRRIIDSTTTTSSCPRARTTTTITAIIGENARTSAQCCRDRMSRRVVVRRGRSEWRAWGD